MTSKPYSPCLAKSRYANRHNARRAIKRIRKMGGKKLYFYECPCCPYYHLTSKNQFANGGKEEK